MRLYEERKIRRKKEIERMEIELSALDKELESSATSPESAGIYSRYEDLKNRLNDELNNWTLYSHRVDEFLKNNS